MMPVSEGRSLYRWEPDDRHGNAGRAESAWRSSAETLTWEYRPMSAPSISDNDGYAAPTMTDTTLRIDGNPGASLVGSSDDDWEPGVAEIEAIDLSHGGSVAQITVIVDSFDGPAVAASAELTPGDVDSLIATLTRIRATIEADPFAGWIGGQVGPLADYPGEPEWVDLGGEA